MGRPPIKYASVEDSARRLFRMRNRTKLGLPNPSPRRRVFLSHNVKDVRFLWQLMHDCGHYRLP